MDNKVDYGRIGLLLNIVEKVSTVCPQYMGMASAAMAELKEINEAIADAAAKDKLPPTSPLAPVEPAKPLPPDGIPTNEIAPHESVKIDQVQVNHPAEPARLERAHELNDEPPYDHENEPPADHDPAPVMRKV